MFPAMPGRSEPLEPRRLFAAVFLTPGTLHVWGSPFIQNTMVVGLTPDLVSVTATVTSQTTAGPQVLTRTVGPASRIRFIDLRGGWVDDVITIDQTNGPFRIAARILAGSGINVVTAGDELDIIGGGRNRDRLDGGNGRNILIGGFGDDTLIGGGGTDLINAGPGSDFIDSGDGRDRVSGGSGPDTINSGAGNDLLAGGGGLDSINAGAGNDTLVDGRSKDTLFSGDGIDSFFVLRLRANPVNDFTIGTDRLRIIVPQNNSGTTIFDDILDSFWPF